MFRTALRNVSAHKARLLMTAFAVMLGVTFITGSLVFGDSLNRAATAQATDGYERIAVEVDLNGSPGGGPGPGAIDAQAVTTLAESPASPSPRAGSTASPPSPAATAARSVTASPTRAPTSPRDRTARTLPTASPRAPARPATTRSPSTRAAPHRAATRR
ncbi:hypothetical protein [Streptomyces sp. RKAG337]|uniref:hypothetical protein n=1 Tax=Streptomyces sp. RKAG337 TaxID=2893404 RepID=UPI0020334EA9|nr:hypothetical protein [Streptomyces sp. RKAG337]MCM2424308.1 hypothetical protein [Streptomyces sp. RKAG337]